MSQEEPHYKPEQYARTPGNDFPQTLSESLFKSYSHAVLELICNSYDADATTAKVTVDPKEDLLIIEDDGTGCDKDSMNAFYRLGDSAKKERKKTAAGRMPIGKKGVATIGLNYLCDTYDLESFCRGERRVVSEAFEGDLNQTKKIDGRIYPCGPEKHGTTITMMGIKAFREKGGLDAEILADIISREMPISDSFRVYVNEKEAKPARIENAKEYAVDKETKHAGRVQGTIYVTRLPIPRKENRGIFLKVHGRAVGDPNYFDAGSYRLSLSSRVVGFINADGLDVCIGFDRTRFNTGNIAFKEVSEIMDEVLREVASDMRVEEDARMRKRMHENMRKESEHVIKNLMKNPRRARVSSLAIGEIKPNSLVSVVEENKIRIKKEYVLPDSDKCLKHLGPVEIAAVFALFKRDIGQASPKVYTPSRLTEIEEAFYSAVEIVSGKRGSSQAPNPGAFKAKPRNYRLFTNTQLAEWKNVDTFLVNRLIACGELTPVKEDKFSEVHIDRCLEKIKGYTPLSKAIEERKPELKNTYTEELNLTKRIARAGKLPEHMMVLGSGKNAFYLVEASQKNPVLDFLYSDKLKLKKSRKGRKDHLSLAKSKGIDVVLMNRLISSGVLKPKKGSDDEFSEEDIDKCIRNIKGFVPLYQVVRDRMSHLESPYSAEFNIVKKIRRSEKLPEHMMALGEGEDTFYLVERKCRDKVFKFLTSDALLLRGKNKEKEEKKEKPKQRKEEKLEEKVQTAEPAKKTEAKKPVAIPGRFEPYNPNKVYAKGTGIKHPELGEGWIIEVTKKSGEIMQMINFKESGVKTLLVGSKGDN